MHRLIEVFVNPFESFSLKTEKIQDELQPAQPRVFTTQPYPTPLETSQDERVPAIPEISSAAATFPIDLAYCCILIPRFINHHLTGDICDYLPEWMRNICLSYGWRLDGIIVRPGYMQWLMTVPPTANPAQFMRLSRQHTSRRIFEEFPRFKQQNISNDFWAPGYFVAASNQLQSQDVISNFIAVTRRQQGIFE